MQIVCYPHPALRWKSKPVVRIDADLKQMVRTMFELMYATNGIGLAANQVAVPLRLFIMNATGSAAESAAEHVFINPEIVRRKGSAEGEEGCLSIPDCREDVTRARTVTVRAQDLTGKVFEHTGEELLARAFLHETDHLNGKLYISHISALKRDLIKRKIKKLVKAGEW